MDNIESFQAHIFKQKPPSLPNTNLINETGNWDQFLLTPKPNQNLAAGHKLKVVTLELGNNVASDENLSQVSHEFSEKKGNRYVQDRIDNGEDQREAVFSRGQW